MTWLLNTRRVVLAILTMGLFVMAARNVTDPDVWWHLRTGELILQTHHVPHSDPYSFTRLGRPWVDHEWLSQVVIYGGYRLTGWMGLILLFAAMIAASFLLVYVRCPGRPYIAALFTIWGAVASVPAWGVRPQAFSLFLGSLFLFVLDRSSRSPDVLWWTIPATILWVNLHAGYALGIALLLLFFAGEILDVGFGREAWNKAKPRLVRLAVATLACLFVVPLNPNGTRMYGYPLDTLSSPAMRRYIDEWMSPNFHLHRYLPFLGLVLALALFLPLSSRRLRPCEMLLLLVTLVGALFSVRHIPIFVLVTVPILAGLAQDCRRQPGFSLLLQSRAGPSQLKLAVNAILVLGLLMFVVVRVRYVGGHQHAIEASHFPEGAVRFISEHKPVGRMLNHYNWGGYFIWKLYPQTPVFIDGRADLYGDALMDQIAATYYLRNDWQLTLKQWDITSVVMPPDAPLITALHVLPGWRQVYADSQAAILIREP